MYTEREIWEATLSGVYGLSMLSASRKRENPSTKVGTGWVGGGSKLTSCGVSGLYLLPNPSKLACDVRIVSIFCKLYAR